MEGLLGEREVIYKKIDKYRNKVQENQKELEDCSLYERYLEGKKIQRELREIEGFRGRIRKWEEYNRNIEIIKKNKLIEDRNRLIEEEIMMVKGELLTIQKLINNDRKISNKFQENKNRQELLMIKRVVLEEKIERAKKQLESKKLEQEARLIKNQIEIDNNEIRRIEKELVVIEKRIIEIEGKIEEYEKNKVEIGVKLVERNRYNMLKEILSPKGFSLWLLEDYLKEMSKGITGILWEMIKLRFEIRIVDNDIMIYSYRGNGDNSEGIRLDMYGGMESFLIDLSFKIVMMEMSKIPKCLFLLIDEGIAAFDNNNLSNLENLWGLLGNIYHNVILITHIDKCKDYLTNIINIETEIEGKYSRIIL
jgi:DNA repair exonuclease SbcCD ATPase subunit